MKHLKRYKDIFEDAQEAHELDYDPILDRDYNQLSEEDKLRYLQADDSNLNLDIDSFKELSHTNQIWYVNKLIDKVYFSEIYDDESAGAAGIFDWKSQYGGGLSYGMSHIIDRDDEYTDTIIKMFFQNPKFIKIANRQIIESVLGRSRNPQEVITLLGQKGTEFLNIITDSEKKGLIQYSQNPVEMVKLIGKKVFDDMTNQELRSALGYSYVPKLFMKIDPERMKRVVKSFTNKVNLYNVYANSSNRDELKDILKIYYPLPRM